MAKSKKLKVYGGCLDGRNRVIVGAYTKAEAAQLLGTNLRYFNMYVSPTGNQREVDICTENPLTVFSKEAHNDRPDAEYIKKS